jgi:acyl phosphate:glycerol-3-phosphate acyltransferase
MTLAVGAESLPLAFASILIGYVFGLFPSAAIIARRGGVDVHQQGSGNPGASNITRLLGWKAGVVVFLLDGAKGVAAAGVGALADGRIGAYLCGIAAVIGHIFPITNRFKGGKGVATGAGLVLAIAPLVSIVVIGTWFLVSRITGKSSLASIIAVTLVPLGIAVRGGTKWEILGVIAVCALIIARHAENIRRLLAGAEHGLKHDKS